MCIRDSLEPGANRWPSEWKAYGRTFATHGGGFSPAKLDAGSQLLVDYMRTEFDALALGEGLPFAVADLGCGNGVVGLAVHDHFSKLGIDNHVIAIDDSMFAVDATGHNWGSSTDVRIHHAHRLVNVCEPMSLDVVVVNPPFHDGRALGDDIAWSMFVDAHKTLRKGGRLVVVGNRHLAYHAKLKKIFGAAANVGSSARFVLLEARR